MAPRDYGGAKSAAPAVGSLLDELGKFGIRLLPDDHGAVAITG